MSEQSLLSTLTGDAEIAAFFGPEAELAALLRFERALAVAEAQSGVISSQAADRIAAICASFIPDWPDLRAGLARDGVIVPALLRQVRQVIGAPHETALHRGATSQDAIDTALVLRLATILEILSTRLQAVIARLDHLVVTQGATPLMAHTRMQRALPFTAADKLAAWQAPLHRHLQRLAELRPRLLVIQFGGPIGIRDDLGNKGTAVAAALARELSLADAPAWHAERDRIVELGNWLALVAGSLGKIGTDLCLMAQNEVNAIAISGGGASSAMAHKANPVTAELIVSLAHFSAGLAATLQPAMLHENERSGAAWTLEWLVLPQLLEAVGAALRRADDLLARVTFRASA